MGPASAREVGRRLSRLARMLVCIPSYRRLTFLDLPREARDTIYRYVFRQDETEQYSWEGQVQPYVPIHHFGLLCTSRQIYEEASAVLYETVDLGCDAWLAFDFLEFIGPKRVLQIQNLGIHYYCRQQCRSTDDFQAEQRNWLPVFDLLCSWGARMRVVDIHFWPCIGDWYGRDHYLETCCRLTWDSKADWFWSGLPTLTAAQEIRFMDAVPEYYANRAARELGWEMDGEVNGGYGDPFRPLNTFAGKLRNPLFTNGSPGIRPWARPRGKVGHFRLLDLPLEIRQLIYHHALEWVSKPFWPTQPARWNAGVGLLRTCKQIAEEAAPFMYSALRIHGGVPLRDLKNFGSNTAHVRNLDIRFSCFCPSGGRSLRHNNDTIYAAGAFDFGEYAQPPFLPGESTAGSKGLQHEDIKGAWTEAMGQIQSLGYLADVAVTFQSCCRSTSYQPPLRLGDSAAFGSASYTRFDPARVRCAELENHFADLLAGCCRNVQQLSLWGNVPPSLAVRLAQPYPGSGLSIRSIGKPMAAFIKDIEVERSNWEKRLEYAELQLTSAIVGDGPHLAWEHSRPFPSDLEYPAQQPTPHFVLGREGSVQGKWTENVIPGWDRLEAGLELVLGPITNKPSWRHLKQFMDCNGEMSTPRFEEPGGGGL